MLSQGGLAEEVTGPHRWQGHWRSENVRRVCCARRCARIDLTHDLVTIVLRLLRRFGCLAHAGPRTVGSALHGTRGEGGRRYPRGEENLFETSLG